MKNEKSESKFDFRPMGLAIKKAREKKGMTQEQLADIIGRDTRTVMYRGFLLFPVYVYYNSEKIGTQGCPGPPHFWSR